MGRSCVNVNEFYKKQLYLFKVCRVPRGPANLCVRTVYGAAQRYGRARLTELTNGWCNWLQLIDLQREYITKALVCIALKSDNTAHI